MKTCTKCRIEKPATTEFFRYLRKDERLLGSCLDCERAAARVRTSARRLADPQANRDAVRAWKQRKPEAKREQDRRLRAKGTWREGLTKEQVAAALADMRNEAAARKSLICVLRQHVERIQKGPEFCWIWNKPGQSDAWRFKTRYRLDPEFAVRQRLKTSARRLIRRDKVGDWVRSAICRGGKSPKAEAMLGYPLSELVAHLERQFTKGMTWDAFRNGGIHIDHIIPLSSFDLTDEAEWKAAWALTNLRPLWATENIRKSNRVLHLV